MNTTVLGLLAGYLALAVLLLNLNLYTRWPVWVKVLMVLVVTGFYFVTYRSLEGLRGWPTQAALPERFLVIASSVREPDKSTGDAGLVHIWITDLADNRPNDLPRAYEIPYSNALHYQLMEARKRMQEGVPQIGRTVAVLSAQGRPRDTSRVAEEASPIVIEDLPDPSLPEK